MSNYRQERREDKRLEAEQQREYERLRREEDRQDRAAEAEQQRREKREKKREAERRAQQRRERRAARSAALRRFVTTRAVDLFVFGVMACALVPAFISQASFLADVGLTFVLACLAAAAIEGATWAFTAMGARAEREGRPTARLRLGTWVCAGVAGAFNLLHWSTEVGPVVGIFFGALTPLATLLWDWRTHTSTSTKTQRREARARARHTKDRARKFKDVHKRYKEILTAYPFGTVEEEQAWANAWADVKGAPLSLDAKTIEKRITAVHAVEEVVSEAEMTPEGFAVEMFLADVFGTRPGGEAGPAAARESGFGEGPHGGVGTLTRDPADGTPESPLALDGKGIRAPGGSSGKGPQNDSGKPSDRPLDEADLAKVRSLADALGGPHRLSAKKVRDAIGCRTDYAIRLRDAVRAEADNT